MKSGLLLSTSVLPFPSFLLSLSLSLVITVKVQLQCLRWELSQRCVTTMWCFTRLVTKPPDVIHTCGPNKSFSHTAICTYHLLPVATLFIPQVLFICPDTTDINSSFSFSCFPGTVLTGKRRKETWFYSDTTIDCLCLFCSWKLCQFANNSLASLLIASCHLSFFISCRLWHFHKLILCATSSRCRNIKKQRGWMCPERTVQTANNETRH